MAHPLGDELTELHVHLGGSVDPAALWGIAPANAGTLGWYSVYGQVLAATLLLIVLVQLAGHARAGPVRGRTAALWALLSVVASTSFGTGLAAAFLLPAVVRVLRPAVTLERSAWAWVLAVPPMIGVLYLVQQRYFLATYVGSADMQRFMQPYMITKENARTSGRNT